MTKRVYFSFHYERDIWRVSQIRNSWVTKSDREEAGYWDAASWETIKKKGDVAIRNWIDDNMKGTSVTAVLIGAETSDRKWVKYEIEKSLEKGNKIIGIRIHNIKDNNGKTNGAGDLDFGLIDGEHTFSELYPVYDWVHDYGYQNFASWIEKTESTTNDVGWLEAVATVAVVAMFTGLVAGFISSLFKPSCPVCKVKILKGTQICPNCRTYLTWN